MRSPNVINVYFIKDNYFSYKHEEPPVHALVAVWNNPKFIPSVDQTLELDDGYYRVTKIFWKSQYKIFVSTVKVFVGT